MVLVVARIVWVGRIIPGFLAVFPSLSARYVLKDAVLEACVVPDHFPFHGNRVRIALVENTPLKSGGTGVNYLLIFKVV